MGMFEGLLGGVMGAEITSLVKGFIEKQGGVQAIADQFEKNGFGDTFKSWVSSGPNAAISPEEIEKAIGPDKIEELSKLLGVPSEKITAVLAEHLPKAVNEMTPSGQAVAA